MANRILLIIDDRSYAFSEIYQHQLHEVLRQNHECSYVELNKIEGFRWKHEYDVIFSAVRIRNLIRQVDRVARFLDGRPIIVQDYDPWTILADDAPFAGGYHMLNDKLNVQAFFVPNRFWTSVMDRQGLPTRCLPIGMLARYCDATSWQNRSIRTDFRGSHYPVREAAFQRLLNAGTPVTWGNEIIKPYSRFLEHLSNIRTWVQSETEPIHVNGEPVSRNWLWPKAIEVLSRGCFLVRDRQDEAEFYEIDRIPTAFLFETETEAPALITRIEAMSDSEKNDRINEAVNFIRNRRYYERISASLKGWYDD